MRPYLAIVIPCYNESSVLPHTLQTLRDLLYTLRQAEKIAPESFLYCIDDGSQDATWHIIAEWNKRYDDVKGVKLTRNVGHQYALLAGLLQVKDTVDCAISIDADLQDDVSAILPMLERFNEGHDIVYGVRQSRQKDKLLKRLTAQLFYHVMKKSGADILYNHADFRLLSRRALNTLNQFEERHLFLRGIFPLMGYPVSAVYYDRNERTHGDSKYTFRKMLSLAWDGVTSFSHLPLRCILSLGVISFFFSLLLVLFALTAKLFAATVPGWTSLMIPLCFMGGIQLLSIGILGEYISKVYMEVKRRPRFIKEEELS